MSVSLDAWEEYALSSIADDLAASAPGLASRLSMFNRLTSGEQMPESLRAAEEERREHHGARPRRRHRRGWFGWLSRECGLVARAADEGTWSVIPVVVSMAVTIAILITLGLTLGATHHTHHSGQCTQTWPVPCSRR
jgi:hypothetical protein